jgi:hypothetical protein
VAAAEHRIVEPYLTAVIEDGDTIVPVSLRERIRAQGLTFAAISADATRYL